MLKKSVIFFLVFIFNLYLYEETTFVLSAQEGYIAISGQDAWLPQHFDNIEFKQTEETGSIIRLSNKEHSVRSGVDLLLHFTPNQEADETGLYRIVEHPGYSDKNTLFGETVGFFQGRGGLTLHPTADTFLGYGITDHDFNINFWFYPFFVEDGEILFEWEGQLDLNSEVIPQRISAIFRANRMVWQFRNVFLIPGQKHSLYEVSSEPYIPENWYHHRIIYDENNGILEILSDNRSEGITYTTGDQKARGPRTTLMISNPQLTNFSIGPKYFGLIDEWEITRMKGQVDMAPTFYYYPSGSAYSKVFDMETHGAQVSKVHLEGRQPEDSEILLYYVIGNNKNDFRDPDSLQWKRLKASKLNIFDRLDDLKLIGRYIQFKVELFSDLKAQVTPSIQGLEVFYYRHRLPSPPSNILVDNYRSGGVYIQWQSSVNSQVAGYKVFVGKYSGQYLEPGYPVDVGDRTSFLFSNLEKKVQYFFVIASYDKYGKIGAFSKEYSIRHIAE